MISRERLAKANSHALRRAKGLAVGIDKFGMGGQTITKEEWIKNYIGRLRKTTKLCSGPCCGNPRKHFGEKTLQERRAELPDE